MSPRKAFTLIELLVVIAIIIILMGMIMGGVTVAKNQAMRTKAVTLVGQVAAAIEQYRSLNSCYPELLKVPSAPAPAAWTDTVGYDTSGKLNGLSPGDDVYVKAFAVGPMTDYWTAVSATLVYQLGPLADGSKAGLFTDPWGKVLRYRPSKYYPFGPGTAPYIDTAKPPNPDSFQLWSTGKDMVEAYGESSSDDITNWQKP